MTAIHPHLRRARQALREAVAVVPHTDADGLAAGAIALRERGERAETLGHVVRRLEPRLGQGDALVRHAGGEQVERGVGERPTPGAHRVGAVGGALREPAVRLAERGGEPRPEFGAQPAPGGEDRVGVDVAPDLARDVGLARQRDDLGGEGVVALGGEEGAERLGEARVE